MNNIAKHDPADLEMVTGGTDESFKNFVINKVMQMIGTGGSLTMFVDSIYRQYPQYMGYDELKELVLSTYYSGYNNPGNRALPQRDPNQPQMRPQPVPPGYPWPVMPFGQ